MNDEKESLKSVMAVATGSLPWRTIGLDARRDLERREKEVRLELHRFIVALAMNALNGILIRPQIRRYPK